MLNRKLNENDVRKLFENHGCIEECTVLRDHNQTSKGCAFVTFASKLSAVSAIKVSVVWPVKLKFNDFCTRLVELESI